MGEQSTGPVDEFAENPTQEYNERVKSEFTIPLIYSDTLVHHYFGAIEKPKS